MKQQTLKQGRNTEPNGSKKGIGNKAPICMQQTITPLLRKNFKPKVVTMRFSKLDDTAPRLDLSECRSNS
ncbi:hypothetical protein ATS71_02765 [Pseudoalteromonas sp. H71]|nr:hypothetical protein ATS71_02765 [Pseudoalteromonas sp. H71]